MSEQTPNTSLDVRHGQQPALYASQFLINVGVEELTLDCSSGVEAKDGTTLVPIHTRLAMSWAAAERLRSLLDQALQQRNATPIPAPHFSDNSAKLPSFGE